MPNSQNHFVSWLYTTVSGRLFLKGLLHSKALKAAELYVKSPASKKIIPAFIKQNQLDMTEYGHVNYHSYAEFFSRQRLAQYQTFDTNPKHLIAPCDSFLSAYQLDQQSVFKIKNSSYRVSDFLDDATLAQKFKNGLCLVFRLEASDYHRYCYVDDCFKHQDHFLEGVLHSVQPLALEQAPVFIKNRRLWTLLETKHFGLIVQTEIGALLVGGIKNNHQTGHFIKGEEMGRFELHGSTIVLLLEKDQVKLTAKYQPAFKTEVKVRQGDWIADALNA